eukprot:TRINITY_DN1825_c0_g1_i1.p1 TRINITY_DN1825_c0_g1~~TRINITY_DN1825_c0_g1_i1.p1  ORF type:complete len:607 (-),score=177.08 TRINITY_DN1825_c0_g1_i1:40-1860(-)
MSDDDWQAEEGEAAEQVDMADQEEDVAEEGLDEEAAEEEQDEAIPDEADETEQVDWAEDDETAEATETSEVKKQVRRKKTIWESGGGKYVVRLPQKLNTSEDAEQFCEELAENVDAKRMAGETLIFEDFDISQNKIPFDQLEAMFSCLSDGAVQVERFRAFGLPTLDDSAAVLLANWLQTVTEENAPFELHLSDGAMTVTGFKAIMDALAENDTFPTKDPKYPDRGKLPLYIRFEGNYIEESAIQESIDQGVAKVMTKSSRPDYSDTVKCRILVREDGQFQQKEGDPPPPDEAPPPKRVNDFGSKGKGKNKDKGSKGGKSSKGKGKDKGSGTPWRDSSSKKDSGRGSSWNDSSKKDSSWKDSKDSSWKDSWKDSSGKEKDSSWKAKDSSWKEKDSSWKDSSWKDASKDSSWKESSWKESNGQKDQERSWYSSSSSSKAKGNDGKGKGKDSSNKRAPAPWQALPEPVAEEERSKRWEKSDNAKGDWDRGKGKSKSSDKGSSKGGGKDQSRGTAPFSAFSSGGRSTSEAKDWEARKRPADFKSGDAQAEKRIRLPPARIEANGSKSKGTGSGADRLPAPWEQHWSEQYKLHYYWNSSTGASSWEKPTA